MKSQSALDPNIYIFESVCSIQLPLRIHVHDVVKLHRKPEEHSVERLYLRQTCFNGCLNKTIKIEPRVAAASGHADTSIRCIGKQATIRKLGKFDAV